MRKLVILLFSLVVLGSVLSVPCYGDDLSLRVSDFYVDIIKSTRNYVSYSWKFTAKSDTTDFPNWVYTDKTYRYQSFYSVKIYDANNFFVDDSYRSFYFTSDDFVIVRATKNSVYGYFEIKVSDTSITSQDNWKGENSLKAIISDTYLE